MEHAENGTLIRDIEDYCKTLPVNYTWKDLTMPESQNDILRPILYEMLDLLEKGIPRDKVFRDLQRKHHMSMKPRFFTQIYLNEQSLGLMKRSTLLENALITSRCRGISGVSVITIFLSPYPNGQTFTCKWNCNYCPNEPDQPRSYLFGEPGVLRANQNNFDCVKQMLARIKAYQVNGHPTDKFEVLILGGTIHSYPKDYLETYMRDIFYAANICQMEDPPRSPLTLQQEKRINTSSQHRVIGVTVETRPDCITPNELRDFRRWGVTRVQIGIQHTDDDILRQVNRGCGHKDTLKAMTLLRDSCFKVDVHIMPNLPGATPEKDKMMMDVVLTSLHPDQVKVYPCETTPFTKILEDYKQGTYVPYADEELEEVIVYWKTRVHPWIRNNRIVRDIPNQYIVAGIKTSSQRLDFQKAMSDRGLTCRCIRCREAGRHNADPADGELVVRTYSAQNGTEYFISWESKNREVLFGFLRLRIPNYSKTHTVFPELAETALIRELHVYGRTFAVGDSATSGKSGNTPVAQHLGIGQTLLQAAENLARYSAYDKIAVISGVGVQHYYERFGYQLADGDGEFMMKSIRELTLYEQFVQFLGNLRIF
jgi:ELP3 family radical SAM enzyme/protein acetyltransferase